MIRAAVFFSLGAALIALWPSFRDWSAPDVVRGIEVPPQTVPAPAAIVPFGRCPRCPGGYMITYADAGPKLCRCMPELKMEPAK